MPPFRGSIAARNFSPRRFVLSSLASTLISDLLGLHVRSGSCRVPKLHVSSAVIVFGYDRRRSAILLWNFLKVPAKGCAALCRTLNCNRLQKILDGSRFVQLYAGVAEEMGPFVTAAKHIPLMPLRARVLNRGQ